MLEQMQMGGGHALVGLYVHYSELSSLDVGRICCRFEDNTSYLRGLGEFFQRNQGHNFQPFFEIKEFGRQIETRKVSWPFSLVPR